MNEAAHAVAISSDLGRQNLERNLAIEFRIERQVHLAHSALAKLLADFVAADFYSGGKAHGIYFSVEIPTEPRTRTFYLRSSRCARFEVVS